MTDPHPGTPDDPTRWRKVRELFEAALDLPPDRAEEFVRDSAGADAALAREVLELLGRHDIEDEFLATPLAAPFAGVVPTGERWVGRSLGPFRILREIARGGMGVVFDAEQDVPRRRVALKVLRSSLLDAETLRRFREESEILARLRHPGIAQVYAAGTAQLDDAGDDLPFIALELVEDARPLPRFADDQGLDWRARIELLLQVCDAVQHGHQRGVIHRDLKPHNVLVDGEGSCKVVDFGIARLVDRDADTARTLAGMVLGTPAYMSPEQLEGDPDAVDVRSDVYALGVLLFELVTGTQPFDVSGKPLTEALRVLRDAVEPPRPSTRAAGLPPEIDWIFGKAAERDVALRYASVSEFAADLRRLIDHEPVLAGPPSTVYRLRKLARRHRLALSAAAVVLVSIVAGLIVSLVSRAEAIAERDRARAERRVAQSVLRFVQDTLSAADPDRMGRDVRVRDLLRDAARELDATQQIDPLVSAALDFTIGSTFAGLGLDDDALDRLRRAYEEFAAHAGPADRRTIEAESSLASALRVVGNADEALAHAENAVDRAATLPVADDVRLDAVNELAIVEQALGRYGPAIARLTEVLDELERLGSDQTAAAVTLHATLGEILRVTADLATARHHLDHAVELATAVHGPGHPRTTSVRHARALILEALGETAEAERELRDVLARSTDTLGPNHRWTLASKGNLGALLRRLNEREEAGELLASLLEERRSLMGPDHELTLATQNNLGLLRMDQQRWPEAEALLRDALDRARRVFEPQDARVPTALQNLASVLRRQQDLDEAELLLEEALVLLEAHAGPDNLRTLQARHNLGVLHRTRGNLARAEELFVSALAGREIQLGPDHPNTLNTLHDLVRVQRAAKRLAEAEINARKLLAGRRARAGEGEDDDWIIAAQMLALVLEERGVVDEPAALHAEAVRAANANEQGREVRAVNVRRVAAGFYGRHGPADEARALALQNVQALERDPELGGSLHDSMLARARELLEQVSGGR